MNSLSFVALFVVAIPVFSAGIHFPSGASNESSDGKWKLTCKSPADGAVDLDHVLLLTEAHGRSVELRRFDRSCSVLWSPDSSWFALTDDWASDRSDVFIYSAAGRVLKKSIGEQFPTNAVPREELTGHCYFDACEWLDGHRLRFKVSGHTDEAPVYSFEHDYVFNLKKGSFEKVIKEKPDKSLKARAVVPKAP
jgi:hypothetical protein